MVFVTFAVLETQKAIPGAGLAAIATIIARVDWRARLIPNSATRAAALLAMWVATSGEDGIVTLLQSLLRGAALFLAFLVFRESFRLWRGRQGMGLGDVKLAGVLGLWLDWPYIPIAVEMACLSALLYILGRKLILATPFDRAEKLPFGAFFAPAIWATWLLATRLS